MTECWNPRHAVYRPSGPTDRDSAKIYETFDLHGFLASLPVSQSAEDDYQQVIFSESEEEEFIHGWCEATDGFPYLDSDEEEFIYGWSGRPEDLLVKLAIKEIFPDTNGSRIRR